MRSNSFIIFFLSFSVFVYSQNIHPLSDDFINLINKKKSTWNAGRNFEENADLSFIKRLMGVIPGKGKYQARIYVHDIKQDLPLSFDAREEWKECSSIGEIRDQGNCGSCWAFGAVEAMSDRICIHSNPRRNISISAEDLLSCCEICGWGCNGGFSTNAWLWWRVAGISTGGGYGDINGCRSYSIAPCEHYTNITENEQCDGIAPTPQCKRVCDNEDLIYESELTFGDEPFTIVPNSEQIQTEIFKNGPVEAEMVVYEDFLQYKNGIYQHLAGTDLGWHAIKILGWGEEVINNETIPYWLAANSWNIYWGDKGFFKILRGENHCEVESNVLGSLPIL